MIFFFGSKFPFCSSGKHSTELVNILRYIDSLLCCFSALLSFSSSTSFSSQKYFSIFYLYFFKRWPDLLKEGGKEEEKPPHLKSKTSYYQIEKIYTLRTFFSTSLLDQQLASLLLYIQLLVFQNALNL